MYMKKYSTNNSAASSAFITQVSIAISYYSSHNVMFTFLMNIMYLLNYINHPNFSILVAPNNSIKVKVKFYLYKPKRHTGQVECILAIYRSPRGVFTNFFKPLDLILQELNNNKYNIIICGDVSVYFLIDNNRRSQLDAVLHSYNLAGTAEFPTRYGLIFQTAIDNVCIGTFTNGKYGFTLFMDSQIMKPSY